MGQPGLAPDAELTQVQVAPLPLLGLNLGQGDKCLRGQIIPRRPPSSMGKLPIGCSMSCAGPSALAQGENQAVTLWPFLCLQSPTCCFFCELGLSYLCFPASICSVWDFWMSPDIPKFCGESSVDGARCSLLQAFKFQCAVHEEWRHTSYLCPPAPIHSIIMPLTLLVINVCPKGKHWIQVRFLSMVQTVEIFPAFCSCLSK